MRKISFNKVVFLDIDGVLNSSSFFKKQWGWKYKDYTDIDIEKVKLLSMIKKKTGCKILMISSWRHGWNHPSLRNDWQYKKVRSTLSRYGIKFNGPYSLLQGFEGSRSEIIETFVEKFNVKHFVVLDDMSYNVINLINTDERFGLSREQAEQAIKLLNKIEADNV